MKIRNIIKPFFAVVLSVMAFTLSSCKERNEEHYLRVSDNSYSFDGNGGDLKISIDATSPWTYSFENGCDWLLEKSKDDKSLTISAKANTLTADRTAKLTIISDKLSQVITLHQLPNGVSGPRYRVIDDFASAAMSPSGIYIAGVTRTRKGTSDEFTLYRMEMATGIRTEVHKEMTELVAIAISDKGVIFCTYNAKSFTTIFKLDNTSYTPAVPAGMNAAVVQAVSVDGMTLVGYAKGSKYPNTQFKALKWTDGAGIAEPTILESPALNGYDEKLRNGVMARGCSADGSVIYGSEWDNRTPVIWTADGAVHNIAKDLFASDTGIVFNPMIGKETTTIVTSGGQLFASVSSMSANGRYLAFNYLKQKIKDKAIVKETFPVIFDIQTSQSFYNASCADGGGLTAFDDGKLSYGMPAYGMMGGGIYDSKSQTSILTSDWVKSNFNLTIAQEIGVYAVSVDMSAVLFVRPIASELGTVYLFSYIYTPKE